MSTFNRVLWRAAERLQRALEPPPIDFQLPNLNDSRIRNLPRRANLLATALRKGWSLAVDVECDRALYDVLSFQSQIQAAMSEIEKTKLNRSVTAQAELYNEFVALEAEFVDCQVNLRDQTVSILTEPIVLQDVELGALRIQLNWKEILDVKARPYTVEALTPRYPASSRQIPHPHVAGTQLCEGDATVPIQQALRSGRLTDFFHIVDRVLHTYNSAGPYAELDEWNAVACHCCSELVSGEADSCGNCQQSICESCWNSCAHCAESRCDACIHSCACCGDSCCSHCLTSCSVCEEQVCPNCFPSDTLCKDCHAHTTSSTPESPGFAATEKSSA